MNTPREVLTAYDGQKVPKYRRRLSQRVNAASTRRVDAERDSLEAAMVSGGLPSSPARAMRRGVGTDVSEAAGHGKVSSSPRRCGEPVSAAPTMARVVACFRRREDAVVSYFPRISLGGRVFSGLRASEARRVPWFGRETRFAVGDGRSSSLATIEDAERGLDLPSVLCTYDTWRQFSDSSEPIRAGASGGAVKRF